MNKLLMIAIIFVFQFLVGVFVYFVAADDSLVELNNINKNNQTIFSMQNVSGSYTNAQDAAVGIWDVFSIMFLFNVPEVSGMPEGIALIISFFNWLLSIFEVVLVILFVVQDIIGNINIKLF